MTIEKNVIIRAIGLAAIICVLALLYGGLSEAGKPGRLSITIREENRQFTVVVSLRDVTPDYRWLAVYACSAAVYEHGTFCTGDFERESTQEIREDQVQYPFLWRNMPRGTLQITSIAFDRDGKSLATGQRTVLRQ